MLDKISKRNRRQLFALAGAVAVLPAFAQSSGRHRGGMDNGTKGARGPGGAQREGPPALEVTLHELQEDLKLTPDQAPLFDAYAQRIRALASDVARDRQLQNRPTAELSVIQRIDRGVDILRDRLTAAEDIAESAKALYGKLVPQQQHVADPRLATLMLLPLSPAAEGAEKPSAR